MDATQDPTDLPDFITGIAEFDEEARWLHRTLSQVRSLWSDFADSAASPGAGPTVADRLQAALFEALNFLHDHVMFEERYMKARGFATTHSLAYELHVEAHADLAQALSELIFKSDTTSVGDTLAALEALISGWLMDHLREHDLVFARVLGSAAS